MGAEQISDLARRQLERQRFVGEGCAEEWAEAGGSWGGKVVEGAGGDWWGSNSVRVAGYQQLGDPGARPGRRMGMSWKCKETGSRKVGQRAAGTGWRAVWGKKGANGWRDAGEVGVSGKGEKGVPVRQPP